MAYYYEGAMFAMMTKSRPGEFPEDVLARALERASERVTHTGTAGPWLGIARNLLRAEFQAVQDDQVRFNAMVEAMTTLGLDVPGTLSRYARRVVRKALAQRGAGSDHGESTDYWKGVADGLLAAEAFVRSPYTYRNDLPGLMRLARTEREELNRELAHNTGRQKRLAALARHAAEPGARDGSVRRKP